MRSFDPMRNSDGSLCIFRVICLGVIALCMLAYASLSMLGCSGSKTSDVINEKTQDSSPLQEEDTVSGSERMLALKTLNEASVYYRECGGLNKGFEGCVFEFPASVLKYYDAAAQAADDGFLVSLKAKSDNDDRECALFETDVTGAVRAYDAQGKISENCLK